MQRRRTFLKGLAGIAAGLEFTKTGRAAPAATRPARAARPAPKPPAIGGNTLSAYAYASRVWVRIGSLPFTCYRADAAQKYPYLFPVFGPNGLPMTDESGEQFPHHRSLFLGCDRVNGGNYWQEELERGQIVSRGPKLKTQAKGRIIITDACDWRQPGKEPIIEDAREWTITAPDDRTRLIDADITLKALADIHVEKTNHSLFSIRAAPTMTPLVGGKLINSAGQVGEKETFANPAEWCGFTAVRCGQPESIILMDHPQNPWSPCKWFTRDYGFASPTPFYWFEKGWDLAAGKSVRLRYRLAVLGGEFDTRRIADVYGEFAS